jgi:lysyl endopeptidase
MRTGLVIVGAVVLLGLGGLAAGPSPAPQPAPSPTKPAATSPITALRAEAGGQATVGVTLAVKRNVSFGRPLTLHYPGASYVKPHVRLVLLPGEYLTVTDAAGEQSTTYRYGIGDRWLQSVDGDTAVLSVRGKLTHVAVDRVARGLTYSENVAQRAADDARRDAAVRAGPRAGDGASRCASEAADAVCFKAGYQVAYRNSRAVALLLIGGTRLCTAWRVGPNNRMLTSHGCLPSGAEARNTEVWFNDECPVCGDIATAVPVKVNAGDLLSTDPTLDFTLFTVQNFAKVRQFGYLSLDVRDPGPGEQLYLPSHQGGGPTVIAIGADQQLGGECEVHAPVADGYAPGTDVSYYCDTAGGSTGAPVISRSSDKVIAMHHFGGCPDSGVRIDLVDRKIGALL